MVRSKFSEPEVYVAYAASAWAFLFALPSFYWAAGGTAGMGLLSPEISTMAQKPGFVAVVWITGLLKVFAGLVALALVLPLGRRVPSGLLLLLAWGGGTLLLGHGLSFLGVGGLALLGIIPVSSALPRAVLESYTYLWGPWFALGGGLFALAAWFYLRGLPNPRSGLGPSILGVLGGLLATAALLMTSL